MDNESIEALQELSIFREAVRRAAREKIAPLASSIDELGEFNRDVESLCWDLGLLTIALPAEFGGLEKYPGTALCIAVEELASVCAASALLLIIQAVGSYPIVHGVSGQIREKVLGRIAKERQLVAYLVTEPSGGSDVAGLKTTAVKDGNEYVLNGTKCFATNGGVASLYSVLARTSKEGGHKGLSFFIVERATPGVKVGRLENKLGQRGSNTTEVFLDDVRVPAVNLLGEEGKGFLLAMKDFDMSRPAVGAQALGIAEGGFEAMLKYSTERRTFGKFLAQHQMIQAIIADTAMRVTTDTVQIMGGYGYMKDYPAERMMRDAKLTQIYTGTNQIMRLVAGRSLLEDE
jgi:cyclohexane-1-carbonyl-CoA dehydrogenase